MLDEAEKRDHRRIGRELDLFHVQEEGPGLVFWHPKGWAIWQAVEQYMRGVYHAVGLSGGAGAAGARCLALAEVGHWDNYQENMFFTESEKRTYALKPMNCPGHVQIFKHGLRSYRELPIRYGEFGACHRNEPSGGLHGILRVRGFTQDDGHIFCMEEQIEAEVTAFHEQALAVYAAFGFTDVPDQDRPSARQADRPPTNSGIAPRACCEALSARPAWRGKNYRVRVRSTRRRSSTTFAMRSAGHGSSARCRSTS